MPNLAPTSPAAPAAPAAPPTPPAALTSSGASLLASVKPTPEPLTEAQLDAALQLHSPVLVKDLYEAAQRQMAFETGRQGRLDAKATGLLQAAGLALTVASTFGAQLAARSGYLKSLPWLLLVMIGGTLLAGLGAAFMAIWALKVRDGEYLTVNERTLFSPDVLEAADSGEAGEQEAAAAVFRRAMTVHLWQIVQRQEQVHHAKAKWIQRGQIAFGLFLLGLLALGAILLASYG